MPLVHDDNDDKQDDGKTWQWQHTLMDEEGRGQELDDERMYYKMFTGLCFIEHNFLM